MKAVVMFSGGKGSFLSAKRAADKFGAQEVVLLFADTMVEDPDVYEFIAAGLPILATDLPEIRKVVKEREIGLVGDTSSSKKIGSLIDNFFSDEQRFANWKANVLIVRQLICWEQEEKKLIPIYEELL